MVAVKVEEQERNNKKKSSKNETETFEKIIKVWNIELIFEKIFKSLFNCKFLK